MNLEEVKEWVKDQHDSIGQKRAGGEPYWTHVYRVGDKVSEYFKDEPDHDVVTKAGYAHDWFEDVSQDYDLLVEVIGEHAAKLVLEVTNKYTKEDYPKLNRKDRKKKEAEKLGKVSYNAKMIKLADIIDNLSDVDTKRPKMAETYKKEKGWVLKEMQEDMPYIVNSELFKQARALVEK